MDNNAIISKTIKNKLEEKMGASSMDINVEYRGGYVHLSGFVDVFAEKTFAEEIVKLMYDVKKVENNITICMDGEISDHHIAAEIDRNLRTDKNANALKNVNPRVSGGTAFLIGSVHTLGDELHALELTKSVRGIKNVVSNLEIVSSHRYDDASIRSKINQVFSQTPDISANVSRGRVTLKGHVRNFEDIEAAIELAAGVEGVTNINNQLRVWKTKNNV